VNKGDKRFNDTITMTSLEGYEIFPPSKNPKKFTVKLDTKKTKSQTVIYGVTGLDKCAMTYKA
jgi:hypothetical protein